MINLDGKQFSPRKNSEGGRVSSDAVFIFQQSGKNFTAEYSGSGFYDGHLIGTFRTETIADLIYHSRAEDGSLEAGQAQAQFSKTKSGQITIKMDWAWLNGNLKTGQSFYEEI